ncbi:Iron permease FTR1 [Nostocoides japonicum T1-X7]|uniref:Iron permease FTR1 n=1 Tax=Nostocoides japonicum T1-X7 TaxID=1194083 RepID=A0A077LZ51_9MICO|nr:iron uptake transporter permease EfeU [Tetrasphaera japonica]CCH79168.1 Iron permease FTR1 [Tetrasphaera japonica T1-X7]
MLATFVIGLREGLEAALIVGIVAAFLTRNNRRLTPMWIGVGAAVLLSLAVGIILHIVETALPQAAQEGMEAVIGAVAIFFVTGMILWMSTHSRGLRGELEAQAREALGDGTSAALVLMAFLAVLKEGFESAVFLLATFQSATNAVAASAGAVAGLGVSIALGVAIYRGGLRINLSTFFRGTGVFLVLVAAGLVATSLRKAHAAGWVNAGQQHTVDLSWLAPVGSIRSALCTGVLGIPADPRLIEVIGWLAYLVPMMPIVLWPPARRPGREASNRIKTAIAAAAVAAAVGLVVLVPTPRFEAPDTASAVDESGTTIGTVRLSPPTTLTASIEEVSTTELNQDRSVTHSGIPAEHLTASRSDLADGLPASLTLGDLVRLNSGRVPIGVDVLRNPGPYTVEWSAVAHLDAWTVEDGLLDATSRSAVVVTLRGGGLPTARTMSLRPGTRLPSGRVVPASWRVAPTYVDAVSVAKGSVDNRRAEAGFWGRVVPGALVVAAAALLTVAWRRRAPLAQVISSAASVSAVPSSISRKDNHVR